MIDTDNVRRDLASLSGTSVDGQPLSDNRAAAPDLSPWIARLVSAKVKNTPDTKISCGMCNDLAYVRIIFDGRWTAETKDGHSSYQNEALLFGQHSKFMPLTCTGDIMSAGIGLRAGAYHALTGRRARGIVDRIEQNDLFGIMHGDLREVFTVEHTPEQWSLAMEEAVRRYIAKVKPSPPDPIATAFERAAFADPGLMLADFAESLDISLRKLERVVRRDFGLTPKKVLRRARALDTASQLSGVADDEEKQEMILRYFDQSHLIREFTAFFGVTPSNFLSRSRPLLTISLEQRQARRLEELALIDPGAKHPWRAD